MLAYVITRIKKSYFEYNPDLILRHKILTFLANRFNQRLQEGSEAKILMDDAYMIKAAILLPDAVKEIGCDDQDFKNAFSVLVYSKEIDYKSGKGIIIADAGFVAVHDQKYIKLAEDEIWKKRERMFNFVSKPILLLTSIATLSFSIFVYQRNISLKEDSKRTEEQLRLMGAKVTKLENIITTK